MGTQPSIPGSTLQDPPQQELMRVLSGRLDRLMQGQEELLTLERDILRVGVICSEKLDIVLQALADADTKHTKARALLVDEMNLLDGNIIYHLNKLRFSFEARLKEVGAGRSLPDAVTKGTSHEL